MPLLVALDEYESAVRAIAIHAQLALSSGPDQEKATALQIILAFCEKVDETVEDVLAHPDAVLQVRIASLVSLMGTFASSIAKPA